MEPDGARTFVQTKSRLQNEIMDAKQMWTEIDKVNQSWSFIQHKFLQSRIAAIELLLYYFQLDIWYIDICKLLHLFLFPFDI